jgi:CSLREA domain-containing protein
MTPRNELRWRWLGILSVCAVSAGTPGGTSRTSSGRLLPAAAAVSDFDGDGVEDLAAVYRLDAGEGAIFVNGRRVATMPLAPDLAVAADLNGDGVPDLAVASLRSKVVRVLEGDGNGNFPTEASIELDGTLTALAVADVNRRDGIADLIVAVDTAAGAKLEIYESPSGALAATPESVPLLSSAHALAAGAFRAGNVSDVVAACDDALVVVAGRDRRLHTPGAQVDPARATARKLDAPAISLAVGRWLAPEDGKLDLALLTTDGALTVLRPFDDAQTGVTIRRTHSIAGPNARIAVAATPDGWRDQVVVLDPDSGRIQAFESDRSTPSAMVLVREADVARGPALAISRKSAGTARAEFGVLSGTDGQVLLPNSPTTALTVNSTGDAVDAIPGNGACDDGSGACTLRAAIQEANALAGADSIGFALGTGTPTIAPASALPDITSVVAIQGNTGGATRVQINGAAVGAGDGLKLATGSSGSLLKSLVINRLGGTGAGIRIESANNTVQDCWIGLDATGSTTVAGNAGGGVVVVGAGATNNLIGGTGAGTRNVISHNTGNGVQIDGGASSNLVQGNYIGTNPGATVAAGNSGDGVSVQSSVGSTTGNVIGGSTATPGIAPGNVISGNAGDGVEINGTPTTGNLIQGNSIGLHGSGLSGIANQQNGVLVSAAPANTIGGTLNVQRNAISGNSFANGDGIELSTAGAVLNNVFGNYIGLDVSGANGVPNGGDGIRIWLSAVNNTIGAATASPGQTGGNVVSGNVGDGIHIEGSQTSGTVIQGNIVGLKASGSAAEKNLNAGISIVGAPSTTVGGTTAPQRNVISGNGGGAVVASTVGANNTFVQGNYIGVDVTGSFGLGNGGGVVFSEPGSTGLAGCVVGGLTAVPGTPPGNVISGNTGIGISIVGSQYGSVQRHPFQRGERNQGDFHIGRDHPRELDLR